jgi:hypothetical protein
VSMGAISSAQRQDSAESDGCADSRIAGSP